jgi:hypothetical protein
MTGKGSAPVVSNTVNTDRAIEWLLAHGSAPVRYLTHTHLLKTNPRSKVMKPLWREVENCRDTMEVFSKQQPDGPWCSGGPWAAKPAYVPKDGYSAFERLRGFAFDDARETPSSHLAPAFGMRESG